MPHAAPLPPEPAERLAPRPSLRPAGRPLRHPASWRAHVHPRGATAAARAAATLRASGVLGEPRADAIFRAAAPDLLGACPFADATDPALDAITLFLATRALYDDAVEGLGEPDPAPILAGLRGELADDPTLPPFVRAWAAVGRALAGRSAPWRARFVARFAAYLASLDAEVDLLAALDAGAPHPELRDYLAWRRPNSGGPLALALVELALDAELSDAVRAHPAFAVAEAVAADLVLAVNDLGGNQRDARAPNLARACAKDPVQGRRVALAWHDQTLATLLAAESALRSSFPRDATLAAWLDGVHTLIVGFDTWHARAPRYHGAPLSKRDAVARATEEQVRAA